jgi:hypothetical protein
MVLVTGHVVRTLAELLVFALQLLHLLLQRLVFGIELLAIGHILVECISETYLRAARWLAREIRSR